MQVLEPTLAQLISASALAEIDHWIAKFPPQHKQSAVLQGLRIIQDEKSWLAPELMDALAAYLNIPKIAVYEAASFYSMYNLEPVGRHKIEVCDNISCMLRDSQKIIQHLEQRLNIKVGDTTTDGKFTLKTAECLGACVHAPVCQVGRKYYENLTPETVDKMLEELK